MPVLYTVPQTDNVAEGAMLAAVARFKVRSPKPEAIVGTGGPAPMPDATIALHLAEAFGLVNAALADRMGPGVYLLQVDASLDGAAMQLAAASLFANRGYNRQAGADNTIDLAMQRALTYLDKLTSPNRTMQPLYVDSSTSSTPGDGSRLGTSCRSDEFVYRELAREGWQGR